MFQWKAADIEEALRASPACASLFLIQAWEIWCEVRCCKKAYTTNKSILQAHLLFRRRPRVKSLSHNLLGLISWTTKSVWSNIMVKSLAPKQDPSAQGSSCCTCLFSPGHQRQSREWRACRPPIMRKLLFHEVLKEWVRHFLFIL